MSDSLRPMGCSTLGFPVLPSLPEFAQIHVHWVNDTIQPSHPLLSLLLLPSVFPSIRCFRSESALCIRWPKYWSFSFSISPANEYFGLISFRIDWFDLLVQRILNSLPQHYNSKASILWPSSFFMVQLIHYYWEIIVLTIQTLVSKVISLLLKMLSRFVIAFLPRIKHLLISWLQSLSYSDVGAQENKIYQCFHFSPIYLLWSDGTKCHDLSFLNVEF